MDGHRRSSRSTAAAGAGQHGSVDECAFLAIMLQVYGSGFTPSSRIIFDGVGRTTIFANENHIYTVLINVGASGTKLVQVWDGDNASSTLNFIVT
jgi:hypothetical protein